LDFSLTYEQQAIREVAEKLSRDLLQEAARKAEKARRVPRDLKLKLAESGLLPAVPQEYGGGGLPDPLALAVALESLAHGDPAITASVAWGAAAAVLIARCGNSRQQDKFLPAFVSDLELSAGVACHEGFGRSPSEYHTRIESKGDGSWRVSGRKVAVFHGATADPLVVVGMDTKADRLRAAIMSPGDQKTTVTSSAALIGLAAAPAVTLEFDATVGEEQLLGGVGADTSILARALSQLRLMNASITLGAARRACEYAASYATERIAFGRPIAEFQGVAFMMADADVQLNAARLEVLDTVVKIEELDRDALEHVVATTLAYAGQIASTVTRDCVQVLGGHGFIADHPVERWYRSAAALSALDFDVMHSGFMPRL
jgi:alkylation response protein AidB-like acyl-CoA dehydrogenase